MEWGIGLCFEVKKREGIWAGLGSLVAFCGYRVFDEGRYKEFVW